MIASVKFQAGMPAKILASAQIWLACSTMVAWAALEKWRFYLLIRALNMARLAVLRQTPLPMIHDTISSWPSKRAVMPMLLHLAFWRQVSLIIVGRFL